MRRRRGTTIWGILQSVMLNRTLSIVIAEEMSLIREGMACVLQTRGSHRISGVAENGEVALQLILEHRPDVAILGLYLERMHVFEVIREVQLRQIPTKVAILSFRKDRKTVLEVLRGGGQGILLPTSNSQNLLDCVEQIYEGGVYVSPEISLQQIFAPDRTAFNDPIESLSAREYQVFSLMVEGIRAKEIAARLKVSPKTIDTYRASMMRKLNIHDVAGLVKFAIKRRLTTADA